MRIGAVVRLPYALLVSDLPCWSMLRGHLFDLFISPQPTSSLLFFPQHSADWRGWLPHAGSLWLGECFLHLWFHVCPLGLLYVEIFAQRRRWDMLQLSQHYLSSQITPADFYSCSPVCPDVSSRLCLQDLLSAWSLLAVVVLSQNLPKDIGCVSLNSVQSGERAALWFNKNQWSCKTENELCSFPYLENILENACRCGRQIIKAILGFVTN